MAKKIRCAVEGSGWVKAKPYPLNKEVMISFFEDDNVGNIWLTPADARKFRKQIKKAIEAIEGVESVEDTTPVEEPKTSETLSPRFKAGDKVRIVGPASYTDQSAFMGQVKEVSNVDITDKVATYDIAGLKGGFSFWFPASSVEPA